MPPPVPKQNVTQFGEIGKSQEVRKVEKRKWVDRQMLLKSYRESFRLSEEDMSKIRFCMEKTGMSKTDIIRAGVDAIYQKNQKIKETPATLPQTTSVST